ncbi:MULTISPECIES: rhamnan synthesis F family protein [unclassified Cyanobium]|uniref:rhamnan synthesis F family protein n=1 Tax=unclassified Cyanobium TaxID=2627006 RepID=UPI0020CC7536|nr:MULTISPECIES: rhamnan synthesis F family protein [unclassified Cyanobium]MCP9860314.1 hypothetical protein [Cyanobium sp. Cruz-8H5]MCP9867581.1 hypothetical protein [Cyanobium sp. Cruz-8D1]
MKTRIINRVRSAWCRLRRKTYICLDFTAAFTDYLLSPYGRTGSPSTRLTELATSSNDLANPQEPPSPGAETPESIAIFVAYSNQLTHSNRAYLQALKQAGFSTFFINNCTTDSEDIAEISSLVWRMFDRENIGRDFGAFKDGVLMLNDEGHLKRCLYLAIANDSMQFIPGRNADELIKRIQRFKESPAKGLFSHISHQIQTHYQSYFQILKPEIFRSNRFLDFWQNYQHLSHRGHCIYQGEIALSSEVYRHFYPVEVLYTSDDLIEVLLATYKHEGGVPGGDLLRLMPSPSRTAENGLIGYSLGQLLESVSKGKPLTTFQAFTIADLIENSNPSHIAAFLYPFFLHCPLVKHDLCIAGSFTIGQAVNLFKELLEYSATSPETGIQIQPFLEEFKQLIYAKGVPMSYSGKTREAAIRGITNGFVYPFTYDG